MPVPTNEFMAAADDMLVQLEKADLLNRQEMERVRKDLVREVKSDMRRSVDRLQTQQFGRTRVLVPNSANLRETRLMSQRVRQRMSSFNLQYLSPNQIAKLRAGGDILGNTKPGEFIRNSHRLARANREFLERVRELEPTLGDEIDATLTQMEDNRMDLLKLEVKSFTKSTENILRNVNGRMRRSDAVRSVENFDIDRNLWNLSLVEHPKAVSRGLLDQASRRMAERVTTSATQVPKRAHVFVASPPDAVSKMTRGSRSAQFQWRLFSLDEIQGVFRALPRAGVTTLAGLGLAHNTKEFYVPVSPENLDEVREVLEERRREFLANLERRGETEGRESR